MGSRWHGLAVDGLAVVAVAVGLVAVHLLVPPAVRAGLGLDYARPDVYHALTAAYVHLNDAHLRANVVGLLAGGAWAILVSRLAGEVRWFRFSLLWFLTVVPIAVGLTAAFLISAPVTSRGFSSVVAAWGGFGLVGIGVVLRRAYGLDPWLSWDVVAAVTVILAAEVVWLVAGRPSRLVAIGLAGAFVLTLMPLVRAGLPTGRREWHRLLRGGVTTVLLSALVGTFVVGLFPVELVNESSVTNVLGHYLGLVYGAVIAGWGYRYWSTA